MGYDAYWRGAIISGRLSALHFQPAGWYASVECMA
jgi:hypothetical protein